jgi:hypothetical protein
MITSMTVHQHRADQQTEVTMDTQLPPTDARHDLARALHSAGMTFAADSTPPALASGLPQVFESRSPPPFQLAPY